MSDEKKDFEQFKLLKEIGYNALAKINSEYYTKAELVAELDKKIKVLEKELTVLQSMIVQQYELLEKLTPKSDRRRRG